MATIARRRSRSTLSRLATCYDEATPSELEIPADLTALDDEALNALHEQAVSAFDDLYGDGQGLDQDELAALSTLADAIDSLRTEVERRAAEAGARTEAAAELAQRVRPQDPPPDDGDGDGDGDGDDGDGDSGDGDGGTVTDPVQVPVEPVPAEPQSIAAGAGAMRINLSSVSRRQAHRQMPARTTDELSMADIIVAAADVPGYAPGQGMSWLDTGRVVDRRLMGFNLSAFEQASARGQVVHQQHPVLTVRTPFSPELTVTSNDPTHIESILSFATSQARLPGNSLVAAGNQGWCAPSTIIYDLCEMESRDGLFSLPTIGVTRGGIQFSMGPDFSDIYNADIGFCFTEQDDIDGKFAPGTNPGDPNVVGDKPCYEVECPDFEDHRMGACGLCITAGLLQMRGYPEMIARVVRGALVAHDHRMSGRMLAQIEAGSDAVTMPNRAGATAPILDAIELQVEHYRYVHRMSRAATLEAVFPYWVTGVIRADLSRRLGVDLLSVTDAQISAWFAARSVAVQFVWNWQDITGPASGFTKWPTTLKFLLYSAGTWVSARTPIITLDTVFDTTLVKQNKYTALFTEEGWLVAQRCPDSRVVTVPVCPDGATHGGIDIACDGTAVTTP